MRLFVTILAAGTALLCGIVHSGGEMPAPRGQASTTAHFVPNQTSTIPPSRIGPPAGCTPIGRECPLPEPYRPVGWGFNGCEKYGPAYYYPYTNNNYQGLNPTYYPFYHPRLGPNYKTGALYCEGHYCGSSRSFQYWDAYDDWMRGGRYEQRQ
ncbi:MAG: hypothetical protein WCK47_04085 [bacterium]|nr:hypothetical protein [Candidatus Sumerlaeota bacterium]